MLFNSLEFVVFLAIVLPSYYLLSWRWQNRLLLIASYVFYGWWDWRFLSLIAISTLVDYICGLAIASSQRKGLFLLISVFTNLGILGLFKYYNFFSESLQQLLLQIGVSWDLQLVSIVLPVGISFYTFQTMSYTIDIYRGKLQPTRNFEVFSLFVSFFPQLVAGPIERASVLLPQLSKPRQCTRSQFEEACWLILSGFYLKVVLADNLAPAVQHVFHSPDQVVGLQILAGVYAAAFQIYGDFAGYSRIARGIAKLLGIDLMKNFNRPYFATSPSDFWQRWHISLSSWLRDYLYIPLGGNRVAGKLHRNLMITMVLGGLWHGASWHFVVWGLYHGVLLCLFRLLETPQESGAKGTKAWKILSFFHLTCIGWLLFFVPDLETIATLLRQSVVPSIAGITTLINLALLAGPVVALEMMGEKCNREHMVLHLPAPMRVFVYGSAVFCICLFGAISDVDFIYFQF